MRRNVTLLTLAVFPLAAQNLFTPDFRIQPDNYTVLMASDAQLSPGLLRHPGDHRKLEVREWTSLAQSFTWRVTAPDSGDYAVNMLLNHHAGSPVTLEVSAGAQKPLSLLISHRPEPERFRWRRFPVPGTLRLEQGANTITLRASGVRRNGNFELSLWSLELVKPEVRDRLAQAALRARVNPADFQALRYGFMVHWTPQSWPSRGERKPYAEAVREFDVEAFADQIKQGGAGFLVLVTAHALQYLPAPIKALDHILPGRTTQRDLVADLAAALQKRGIRLFVYYHLGSIDDPDFLRASGFWETDTTRFFNNWVSIVTEIGERYGTRLAGWWFDDGMCNYYYRSPDWERLNRASKAGNPQRLTTFNRWLWPTATDFEDYDACEVCTDSAATGWLPVGGDGRYLDGPAKGLPAAATLITEGDWLHTRKDTPIGPPRWTTPQMKLYLRDFAARRIVPIFNLEIYQEGRVSPASIAVFAAAHGN